MTGSVPTPAQQDETPLTSSYRVVETGVTETGLSTIAKDNVVPVNTVPDGRGLSRLWEADGVLPGGDAATSGDDAAESPFFPEAGGVRFWSVTVPPETPGTPPPAEFHQTSSLDVGIVLSGRIVLEMEDGTSAELSAGEAFAQLGTPHNWRNPYSVDAVIAVVMMGRDK
ncbi:cupin domain-containing protein [Streptomyces prunicolor]|uniref:Cupin domain-containing protein n=1 Tax=Streptomyces prunicolor TaxID=67348 RepID=A0ABU4F5P1_9ACTN|nr:cupin domain-containing protein [Streptomyces prunicolor]MDV7215906.1 cupin domain-containing protein [Streptomyces prunicolor]